MDPPKAKTVGSGHGGFGEAGNGAFSAFGTYGSAGARYGSPFHPGKRPTVKKMNVLGIVLSTFVPWVIFCLLAAALSFEMHYRQPSTVQALVVATAAFFVLAFIADVLWIFQKRAMGTAGMANASWVLFICITSLFAVMFAVVFGNKNFWHNSEPFFDITALNSYDAVDPSNVRGQELMDAGQIHFEQSVHLDLTKSMGFKNQNTFCVAPITIPNGDIWNPPLASYDFWAVGKDCCSGTGEANFQCGAYNDPHARSAIRMVRDNERAFYRLAVQQAQSAYAIKAMHPLFFHWVADPVAETYRLQQNAFKAYLLAMACYLVCQLSVVALAASCFHKFRQY